MNGLLLWPAERETTALILPTAAEVERYGAAPAEPADELLAENDKGLPIVRKPVGIRQVTT